MEKERKEEGNRTRVRVWKRNRETETEIETMGRKREIKGRREASKQTRRVTAPSLSPVDPSCIPRPTRVKERTHAYKLSSKFHHPSTQDK